MSEIFDLDEMIKKSVNRERLSYEMYKQWKGRLKDENGNKALAMLMREEEGHIKLLELTLADKKFDRLGRRDQPRKGPPLRIPDVHEITEDTTAKEVIAFAIHHEERAVQYYSRYMDTFRDTPLFEFFAHMKVEEEKHKDRLEAIFLRDYAGRKG